METLLATIGNKVLSETGLVCAILLVGLWWVAREWSAERKSHKETIDKAMNMAVDHIKASSSTTEALNKLSGSVERLTYTVGGKA